MTPTSLGLKMQYSESLKSFKKNHPLFVIIGPTAVGKTDLSIELAQKFNGEIISADSRLFYRGMDIGTAKPDLEQLKKVPHHLINVADPDEIWSLALFQGAADQAISEIHSREKIPFLVGGTGQYIRAVLDGWHLPAQEPDYRLREVLEKWGNELGAAELYRRLTIIDPLAAEYIEPGNMRRSVRALEVIFHTGKTFSSQRGSRPSSYTYKIIGLTRPRAELYQRIDQRIELMLEQGLIEEVKLLINKGYSPDMSALSAIGYREIYAYLSNQITLDEAIVLMKRYTRQYVRRQANWFKESDPTIRWFNPAISSYDEIADYLSSNVGWIEAGKTLSSH